MIPGFLKRLLSGIPRTAGADEEQKQADLARCRFFVDGVQQFDDDAVGLQGLVQRGRVYVDEPLELVGYGEKTTVRCYGIWKGEARQDYAWRQTHFDPFVLGVKHDDPSIFRKGQVLAAPGTADNAVRCDATVDVTGTPGNLEHPLASGFEGNVHFRQAVVPCAVTLPAGRDRALPGETADIQIRMSEPLPLEPGDEIRLGSLGHVFAHGQVSATNPIG